MLGQSNSNSLVAWLIQGSEEVSECSWFQITYLKQSGQIGPTHLPMDSLQEFFSQGLRTYSVYYGTLCVTCTLTWGIVKI